MPVHSVFNYSDADVTFRSCDGVLFKIHKINLEITTGGFPPASFDACGEEVPLEESSETLGLLFEFVYPRRHPTLAKTPLDVLAPLADAAEKYEVYAAINMCYMRMSRLLLDMNVEPERIVVYGAKHNYMGIVDSAFPRILSYTTGKMEQLLPPHLVLAWVCYRQQWQDILISAIKRVGEYNAYNCQRCHGQMTGKLMSQLCGSPLTLLCVRSLIEAGRPTCPECPTKLYDWEQDIKRQVDDIKPFSQFL